MRRPQHLACKPCKLYSPSPLSALALIACWAAFVVVGQSPTVFASAGGGAESTVMWPALKRRPTYILMYIPDCEPRITSKPRLQEFRFNLLPRIPPFPGLSTKGAVKPRRQAGGFIGSILSRRRFKLSICTMAAL